MTTLDTVPEAGPRRRGPYSKTKARRGEILDAALEVFAQSGYRAGSLREVAARVGISETGILHHFNSKSALLAAVLERRDELARVIVPMPGSDALVTLTNLIVLARHNESSPGVVALYCMLSAEATSPQHPAHGYFVARYAAMRADIGQAFRDLDDRGLLAPGTDAESAVVSSLALWDGLQVQWLLDQSSVDLPSQLGAHFRRLLVVDLPDGTDQVGAARLPA